MVSFPFCFWYFLTFVLVVVLLFCIYHLLVFCPLVLWNCCLNTCFVNLYHLTDRQTDFKSGTGKLKKKELKKSFLISHGECFPKLHLQYLFSLLDLTIWHSRSHFSNSVLYNSTTLTTKGVWLPRANEKDIITCNVEYTEML